MEHSETMGAIATALAEAHKAIENPALDKVNPHFNSRFASLAAHLNAVRKPLADNGISVVQTLSSGDGAIVVNTTLLHKSGEWIGDSLAFPMPEKATAQAAGSLVTYARRYALASIAGIVGEDDDDGNADKDAGERPAMRPVSRTASKPEPKPSWPKEGTTEGVFTKSMRRGDAWAVFVDQSEYGQYWLRASEELGKAALAALNKRMEIDFKADKGIVDLISFRPAQPSLIPIGGGE